MNKTLQKDVKINTKMKNHIKKKNPHGLPDSLKGVIEQNKNKARVHILELMVLAIIIAFIRHSTESLNFVFMRITRR